MWVVHTATMPAYPSLDIDPRTIPALLRTEILAGADEAKSIRRLPPTLLASLRAAGAFRLLTPRELGGFECDLRTMCEVIEAFARIDGSVAWNVWNGNLGFSAAMLDNAGVDAIWGSQPDPVIANSARVVGAATPTDDGFVLSGRWDIVSAIDSCDWVVLFGIVLDGDAPRFVSPGMPDVRAFYLSRDQFSILDTWHVSAMRGTGSNTVVVDDALVPGFLAPSPLLQ